MMEPIDSIGSVKLVPTWEAAARIFTQNLLYGKDISVQDKSADELIKMGQLLDKFIAGDEISEVQESKLKYIKPHK